LDAGGEIEAVFVDAEADAAAHAPLIDSAAQRGVRVFELAEGVLAKVADTVTPQPLLTVLRIPPASLNQLADTDFVVVCVAVRDPGNLGTVIRSADAAGAQAVVCCDGTADPYNPKTVRASAGHGRHRRVAQRLHGGDGAVLRGAAPAF
jgi:TrmH family RNA methyltransferase